MMQIRRIHEDDIGAVIQLYRTVYGDSFPFRSFYDASWIKKGVFSDDIVWYVVETEEGRIIASAALMHQKERRQDLIAEFGRFVVDPDSHHKGLGTKLCDVLLAEGRHEIDFGFAECRTAHVGAQKIFESRGFSLAGFAPFAYRLFDKRESCALYFSLFGNAKKLRRNNPHVIPEVYALGASALRACELEDDLLVEQFIKPYRVDRDPALTLTSLKETEVYRLLRISGGNYDRPEVFGALVLQNGYLRISSNAGRYLVLQHHEIVVGGIGYVWDEVDAKLRIFELITANHDLISSLLELTITRLTEEHPWEYIEIDVSAHAPKLQRTLCDFGFSPTAYFPSMVYQAGERLDVVRLVKLSFTPEFSGMVVVETSKRELARLRQVFETRRRQREHTCAARQIRAFQGLNDVQFQSIAQVSREVDYPADAWVFRANDPGQCLFVVLHGSVTIHVDDVEEPVVTVERGESFGEMALLDESPRSAGARCDEPTTLLEISWAELTTLMECDTHLGMTLYRNLAMSLSEQVRNMDANLRRTVCKGVELLSPPD